jgi:serine/threonine-protein kinase
VVGWSAAAALMAAAAVVIALLPHLTSPDAGDHRPRAGAAHGSGGPAVRAHRTAAAKGALVASPLSGPDLSPSAARPRPDSLASQAPAIPPSAASPSAPPPSGRAAFGGTWSGTVSQPGSTAPSWTVELVIPAAGRDGSYSAPSLGCSGTLVVQKAAGANMTAMARTTSTVYPGCVVQARLFLTLSGSNGMSMAWRPVGHPHQPGTAMLARG